jgi:hypothetical protein
MNSVLRSARVSMFDDAALRGIRDRLLLTARDVAIPAEAPASEWRDQPRLTCQRFVLVGFGLRLAGGFG